MPLSESVKDYLSLHRVRYDTIVHSTTQDASHTAQAVHVPGARVAKAVVLEDDNGYVMAVIPASHRLDLQALGRELHRDLALTREPNLLSLFQDCAPGAIPALGQAYGMETVVDQALIENPAIYFEGGDHLSLIRVSGAEFRRLMANSLQRAISTHR